MHASLLQPACLPAGLLYLATLFHIFHLDLHQVRCVHGLSQRAWLTAELACLLSTAALASLTTSALGRGSMCETRGSPCVCGPCWFTID